jgi:hypothetical protein
MSEMILTTKELYLDASVSFYTLGSIDCKSIGPAVYNYLCKPPRIVS